MGRMTDAENPWCEGADPEEKRASKVLELALRREMLVQDALDAALRRRGIDPESAASGEILDAVLEEGLLHPSAVAGLEREIREALEYTPFVLDEFDDVPVRDWDRYELIGFLGRGGMGDVYKARDPRLGRLVAIKFLRRDDPQVLARFVREARIQARVDHEGVCPVYEVGEVEGHPYIVMQYVSGGALPEIRDRLQLREMVQIMADAAEALHAAHRLELVHRDVKPANIMVEYTEGGLWRPFVVDFGIARELDSDGMTQSGAVLGTPAFAAPEQIQGKIQEIDARSDVYSLGATLYWLISERAPFEGGFAEILRGHTTTDGPEPPSDFNPGVSRDLDTIILKCLEIDRNRRYETAFEVAEDLRRYLAGEAILARRGGFIYRLKRKARRHAAVTGALAAFMIVGLGLGIYSLYDRWETARRAAITQTLLDRVSGIEELMRISVMMPLHDSTQERRIVHRRIEEIREEMGRLGSKARGPGRYALGKAHLVIGETSEALEDLRASWNSGFRSPAAASAYGRALGRVYEKELRESSHIASPELRRHAEEQLSERYRKPALDLLQEGGGNDLESSDAVLARIAFYEGRPAAARDAAERAVEQMPWDYGSLRLLGDLELARATGLAAGGAVEGALEILKSSREAYARALEIARSDPETMMAQCHCRLREMEILERNGISGEEAFQEARRSCRAARQVAPEEAGPWETSAHLFWSRAEQLNDRGEDPQENLRRAGEAARKAIALDPVSAGAHHALGGILTLAASRESGVGEDPGDLLAESIASLEKARELAPSDPVIADDLGYAHDRRARHLLERGQDPDQDIEDALEAYSQAINLSPDYPNAYNNSGIAWWRRAVYFDRSGGETESALAHAEDFFHRALKLNPRYAFALTNLGMVYRLRGERLAEAGEKYSESLSKSLELIDQAIAINPRLAYAWREKARTALVQLRSGIDRGRKAEDALFLARGAVGRAMELDPGKAEVHSLMAEVHYEHAALLQRRGKSMKREIARGLVEIREALQLNERSWKSMLVRARLLKLEAGQAGAEGQKLDAEAEKWIRRARELNPGAG